MNGTIIVTGSRSWSSQDAVWCQLHALNPDTVVTGACPTGADLFAKLWARKHNVQLIEYPAEWSTHGRRAGPLRNAAMLRAHPNATVLAAPNTA